MPPRNTPLPQSPPPGSLPPPLMHSWTSLSHSTASSARSKFYEHLQSPNAPSVPRAASPYPSSDFGHDDIDDDLDLETGRRFSLESSPTQPRFPTRIFSYGRSALNPLLDRPPPPTPLRAAAHTQNTLGLTGMSHRLSRQIESVRQFVLNYRPPPAFESIDEGPAGAYAKLEGKGTPPLMMSPPPVPGKKTRFVSVPVPIVGVSAETAARAAGPQRLSDVHVDLEPLRWKRREEIDIRVRDQRRQEGREQRRGVKEKKRKRRWLIPTLIIIILLLIIFAILGGVLGSRAQSSASAGVAANSTASPIVTYSLDPTTQVVTQDGTTIVTVSTATVSYTTTPTPTASATPTLSPALQSCLDQFQLSAPTSPQTYPCGTCVPLLQTLPNDLSPTTTQNISSLTGGVSPGSALQFCSLQSIFAAASTTANGSSNPLSAGGWMVNNEPCQGWSGVSCDAQGRVTQLVMAFPGVPAAMPDDMGGLVGLQELQITGNGAIPSGAIPPSLFELAGLTQLQLVSTGLSGLGANETALAQLSSLQHLVLAQNPNLGDTLPSALADLPLSSLIVNNQNLTGTTLSSLLSSSTLWPRTLTTLDLSNNALTLPSSSSLLSKYTSLTELNLASNSLSGSASTVLASLPAGIQVLDMAGNTGLDGQVPAALCGMTTLQSCDFRGTAATPPGGANGTCGVCLFGSA